MDGETFTAAYVKHNKEMEDIKKKIQNYDDKIENGEDLTPKQEQQLERWTKRLSELTELSKEYVKAARRRGQGWDYTRSVPSDLVRTSEEEDRCGSDISGHPAGSLLLDSPFDDRGMEEHRVPDLDHSFGSTSDSDVTPPKRRISGLTSEGYLHYYLHKIGFFPAPDKSKDD